ncbi:hypothetical protein GCM10027440_55430 [Nocardiopsis coralliicola]
MENRPTTRTLSGGHAPGVSSGAARISSAHGRGAPRRQQAAGAGAGGGRLGVSVEGMKGLVVVLGSMLGMMAVLAVIATVLAP